MRAIYLPTARHGSIELRDVAGLDDTQRAVRGLFEHVSLHDPEMSMLINEEGKLANLPINHRATALLWSHNEDLAFTDYIRGNVLLVGDIDAEGEYQDVPSLIETLITSTLRFDVSSQRKGSFPRMVVHNVDDVWDAYAVAIKLMGRGISYRVTAA